MLRAIRRMSTRASFDVRSSFLKYMSENNHVIIPSAPLVPPAADHSLLFVGAGMVPFKHRYVSEVPNKGSKNSSSYVNPALAAPNLTSVQRCLRVGGKDCDLENVGHTQRHLTLFEMLGNFSFGNTDGSYFKEQAIDLAFVYLTKVLHIPHSQLYVTYLTGDDETRLLWTKYFANDRIRAMGRADNHWQMGVASDMPCGACTEIYYEYTKNQLEEHQHQHQQQQQQQQQQLPTSLEIWNIVFMENTVGGSKLKYKSVDTGMGLERLQTVLENVFSPFETSEFRPLMEKVSSLLKRPVSDPMVKIVSDHARSSVMLAIDGVTPSHNGRGHVLRRLIRRASQCAYQCGYSSQSPILPILIPYVHQSFNNHYVGKQQPNNNEKQQQQQCETVLAAEEMAFLANLEPGMKYLQQQASKIKNDNNEISAHAIFTLQTQFGFPSDLANLICKTNNWTYNWELLQQLERQHREISKNNSNNENENNDNKNDDFVRSKLSGGKFDYSNFENGNSVVVSEICDDWISLSPCPFYGTQGGQPCDRGYISTTTGIKYDVVDCQPLGNNNDNIVRIRKTNNNDEIENNNNGNNNNNDDIKVGDVVKIYIDKNYRQQLSAHHTATHLIQSALKFHISPNVSQCGSRITENSLKFDFFIPPQNNNNAMNSNEAIANKVDQYLQQCILQQCDVSTNNNALLLQAKQDGVTTMAGENYPDVVRIVSVKGKSQELCAGTHVLNTREIYPFHVISVKSIGANVKRIEATAHDATISHLKRESESLHQILQQLQCANDVEGAIQKLKKLQIVEKEARKAGNSNNISNLKSRTTTTMGFDGVFRIHVVENADISALKILAHNLRSTNPELIHILHSTTTKAVVVALDSKTTTTTNAQKLLSNIVVQCGQNSKGGGNVELAQGILARQCTADELKEWTQKFRK